MLSPDTTQSYRFGPDSGDESQICLFVGCLLTMYVPFGGRVMERTPACPYGQYNFNHLVVFPK